MKHPTIILTFILASLVSGLITLRAIKAESFEFNPATSSFPQVCAREVDVIIDTASQHSNAADIEIHYDVSKIDIIDSLPAQSGVQVKPGNAYDAYVYNQVDTINGIIRVATGALTGDLVGKKTFITINFKSKAGVTNAGFNIIFTGVNNTLDSNIAETVSNLDILTFVTNGNYTFTNTACNPDTTPPVIKINKPSITSYTGPLHIEAELTDAQSGVDITTFQLVANGITFTPTSVVINQSGDKFHYYISFDPPFTVNSAPATTLTFIVKDFSGNTGTASKLLNPSLPTSIPITTPTQPVCNTDNSIYNLPETGTKNPGTISFCQNLINENQKQDWLIEFNQKIPVIGSFGLLSLLLALQSIPMLYYLFGTINKNSSKPGIDQGVLLAKDNRSPIINTVVKLYDLQGHKIGETVSDLHGRYSFDIQPGNYIIRVAGKNFKDLQAKINIANDGKYNYHMMEFKNGSSKIKEVGNRVTGLFFKDVLAFSMTAFVFSSFALVLNPNPYTIGIFTVNLILLTLCSIVRIWSNLKLGI